MKIAPKSHFHTAPVIISLGSNVNDTLKLYLTISSLEWHNSPQLAFIPPNLEAEAGEQLMENQTVGISFCPNSGRGVKKSLK